MGCAYFTTHEGGKVGNLKTIRKEGGSRVISITHIIPVEWTFVELVIVKTTKDVVTLKINKVK